MSETNTNETGAAAGDACSFCGRLASEGGGLVGKGPDIGPPVACLCAKCARMYNDFFTEEAARETTVNEAKGETAKGEEPCLRCALRAIIEANDEYSDAICRDEPDEAAADVALERRDDAIGAAEKALRANPVIDALLDVVASRNHEWDLSLGPTAHPDFGAPELFDLLTETRLYRLAYPEEHARAVAIAAKDLQARGYSVFAPDGSPWPETETEVQS